MAVLGITGGVACGKSTLTAALAFGLKAAVFDSDAYVRALGADEGVKQELREQFGGAIFGSGGDLDRAALRQVVFQDPSARTRLEGIMHPRVRAGWREAASGHRAACRKEKERLDGQRLGVASSFLLVEIPLLYEVGVQAEFDRVIVVACSQAQQLERLCKGRGLSREVATGIIHAQHPLADKILLSDHLVWSGGSREALKQQADSLGELLKRVYV